MKKFFLTLLAVSMIVVLGGCSVENDAHVKKVLEGKTKPKDKKTKAA